ncbi:hypothetical protein FACS189461_1120 [Spirochaetia bacterium]|nr:hypothetical protein FACS189461_1120 [Spirochaetia bacterium]
MDALSVRDFKSLTQELWHEAAQTGTVTLTVDLANENMDDLKEVFQRLKTMQAIHRMRAAASARPPLTDIEIDAEIHAARAELKDRGITV